MAQTEAQLRASKKYHQKYEYLQARVTPAEKEAVTEHAAAVGESLNVLCVAHLQKQWNETKRMVDLIPNNTINLLTVYCPDQIILL